MASRFACLVVLLSGLLFATTSAQAGNLSLLVNGKALHMGAPSNLDLNESNWGLGVQYDYETRNHWRPFWTASGFLDSLENASYYAGGGVMRRILLTQRTERPLYFDAGIIGFVMTRKNFNQGSPFPGVLPAFSLGNDLVAVNITYIPDISPKFVPLWFFQLKVSTAVFSH